MQSGPQNRRVGCCSHIAAIMVLLVCLDHGADLKDFLLSVKKAVGQEDYRGAEDESEQSEEDNPDDDLG